MKINLFGKEYDLGKIDCIRINEKIIGIDKKCWLEVVENGVATKIEGTNTIGKAASVESLKRIMEQLKDKGSYVIDVNKSFLVNIDKAEKVEFYDNLSLLGRKYFLRVKLNGKTFDTMHTYNKKRYEGIEANFRKQQNEKLPKTIAEITNDKKYNSLKSLNSHTEESIQTLK